MTIGEISDQVSETNAALDEYEDRKRLALVRETTARIMAIISPPEPLTTESHAYRPGAHGCSSCRYPKDHPVHRA